MDESLHYNRDEDRYLTECVLAPRIVHLMPGEQPPAFVRPLADVEERAAPRSIAGNRPLRRDYLVFAVWALALGRLPSTNEIQDFANLVQRVIAEEWRSDWIDARRRVELEQHWARRAIAGRRIATARPQRVDYFAFAIWAYAQPEVPATDAIQKFARLSLRSVAADWRTDWVAALLAFSTHQPAATGSVPTTTGES